MPDPVITFPTDVRTNPFLRILGLGITPEQRTLERQSVFQSEVDQVNRQRAQALTTAQNQLFQGMIEQHNALVQQGMDPNIAIRQVMTDPNIISNPNISAQDLQGMLVQFVEATRPQRETLGVDDRLVNPSTGEVVVGQGTRTQVLGPGQSLAQGVPGQMQITDPGTEFITANQDQNVIAATRGQTPQAIQRGQADPSQLASDLLDATGNVNDQTTNALRTMAGQELGLQPTLNPATGEVTLAGSPEMQQQATTIAARASEVLRLGLATNVAQAIEMATGRSPIPQAPVVRTPANASFFDAQASQRPQTTVVFGSDGNFHVLPLISEGGVPLTEAQANQLFQQGRLRSMGSFATEQEAFDAQGQQQVAQVSPVTPVEQQQAGETTVPQRQRNRLNEQNNQIDAFITQLGVTGFQDAELGTGLVANIQTSIDNALGAFFEGTQFQDTAQARQRLRILRNQLVQSLADDDRISNEERRQLFELFPDPASLLKNPETAKQDMATLVIELMRRRQINEAILSGQRPEGSTMELEEVPRGERGSVQSVVQDALGILNEATGGQQQDAANSEAVQSIVQMIESGQEVPDEMLDGLSDAEQAALLEALEANGGE